MLTEPLRQREAQIAERLARLSDRELAELILTVQSRPHRNRRDARYTFMYVKLARDELHRRRGGEPS